MTKAEIKDALESVRGAVSDIIRNSPSILPKQATTREITEYASALGNLNFVMTDLGRAIDHIDSMKGGDASV